MSDSIFNTTFETSLRVVLLLSEKAFISSEQILAVDFIATFAKYFEISDFNLNGNGRVQLRGFSARRGLVQSAIKGLVLKGFVKPVLDDNQFMYSLTDYGLAFATKLDAQYAKEYRNIIKKILQQWPGLKESELNYVINRQQRILSTGADLEGAK